MRTMQTVSYDEKSTICKKPTKDHYAPIVRRRMDVCASTSNNDIYALPFSFIVYDLLCT